MKGNGFKRCFYSKAGFTLIELLVVVLIIGILVAVALPQYQRALLKARYVQLMVVTKTMAESAQRSYLANGTAPQYWAEMDVELPAGCATSDAIGVTLNCEKLNMKCDLGWGVLKDIACFYPKDAAKTALGYDVFFTPDRLNQHYCIARATDTNANDVCKGLGGSHSEIRSGKVHFGEDSQVNIYTLP